MSQQLSLTGFLCRCRTYSRHPSNVQVYWQQCDTPLVNTDDIFLDEGTSMDGF